MPLLDPEYQDPEGWPDDLHDGIVIAAVLTYRNARARPRGRRARRGPVRAAYRVGSVDPSPARSVSRRGVVGSVSTLARSGELIAALVGEPATFTAAPGSTRSRRFPPVIVDSPPAGWLEGSTDSGPGRVVLLTIDVVVVVNAAEPIGAAGRSGGRGRARARAHPALVAVRSGRGAPTVAARGGELTALLVSTLRSRCVTRSSRRDRNGSSRNPHAGAVHGEGRHSIGRVSGERGDGEFRRAQRRR